MARPGRKPKPVEAHRRDGTRPHAPADDVRPNLVAGRERPDRPAGLDADARKVWDTVLDDLEEGNVLDKADWSVVEVFCVEVARLRQARRLMKKLEDHDPMAKLTGGLLATGQKSAAVISPLRTVEERAGKNVASLADSLGLGPSGRARLGIARKGKGGRPMGREQGKGVPESPRARRGGLGVLDGGKT